MVARRAAVVQIGIAMTRMTAIIVRDAVATGSPISWKHASTTVAGSSMMRMSPATRIASSAAVAP
ncbi:hypothetical protein BW07_06425 [Bifidobacterium sp. UTCIF-36]|nr:hypothetical protein BW07_06425 [Bifidobacterium sp. UTCIF-36]